MLTQAILIGLIAAFGKFDCQLGTLYAFRPIVLCPLVGLVLGDLQSGLAIGASLELLFSDESAPVEETIRAIVAADDTRVKFVNDLLVDDEEEEEF